MNVITNRRARYYLRLSYPVRVVACRNGYRGALPDLPGCETRMPELAQLYTSLERMRREWISLRVREGAAIPLPNSRDPAARWAFNVTGF